MQVADVPCRVVTRRRWTIRGQVQGVGFRPFVYRVAQELGITGFVRNDSSAVIVEGQGEAALVRLFGDRLVSDRPAAAVYAELEVEYLAVAAGEAAFEIQTSQVDQGHRPTVTVDLAVCPECLREMGEAADFRFGYALINCTNCGPRYSIVREMPYDRANTTMAGFALCQRCRVQYENPVDRRFHAQPVACPACGPRVELVAGERGEQVARDGQAIAAAADLLLAGKILAVKGLGGFHLACRADDPAALRTLRDRKKRDSKPFALMAANLQVAKELVELSESAIAQLTSPAAPIVLSKRQARGRLGDDTVVELIAPGTDRLGVLLAYTPLHHLLFAALSGRCEVLVMTSANLSDEPLVKDDAEAADRLAGIADAMLWHNRDIERCVDDSIVLDLGEGEALLPIRRARGYVPQVIALPSVACSPGLCVGGELKNTVALVRGGEVIVSQHLGDLKHTRGYEYFQKAIEDLCRLMEVRPAWVAHDLHPAYLSTQHAKALAARWGVPAVGVQHHHAHAAAVLGEHGHFGPALAVVCDGVGYGVDGTAWGGELLGLAGENGQKWGWGSGVAAGVTRLGHLQPIRLPGGDAAARDGRRCAAGVLWGMKQAGLCDEFHPLLEELFPDKLERALVCGMLESGHGCVSSSAAGRWFDAVAALVGVCQSNDHEARAPMALEACAAASPEGAGAALAVPASVADGVIDPLAFVAELVGRHRSGESAGRLAMAFHEMFSIAWADLVSDAAEKSGVRVVGLSGGVFCNALLTKRLTQLLRERGMRVLRHEVVPPNDGGIAFGQAVVMSRGKGVL